MLDSPLDDQLYALALCERYLGNLKILDTHGEVIKEEVFALFKYLLEKTEVKAVLLERDSNFPEFSNIISELVRVKGMMKESSLIVNN